MLIAEIENIVSRIKDDEAAMLSKTELIEILEQLKAYKELQEKFRLISSGKVI